MHILPRWVKLSQLVNFPVSVTVTLNLTPLCLIRWLTLKASVTTAADDIHKYFSLFSKKIRLDVSSESSVTRQRIYMKKNQALFSSKDRSKKLRCRLLQFLFGALRVIANVSDSIMINLVLLLMSDKRLYCSSMAILEI